MADPRRTSTRRAVLSYDQLKRLTDEAGFKWPDLLIKDYQGIIQDFITLADDADIFEVDIANLKTRVAALEYKVFETVFTDVDYESEEFQTVICNNVGSINVTLKPIPIRDDEVNIKRTNGVVNVLGLIDGVTNKVINVRNYSMKLVFNGTEWNEI